MESIKRKLLIKKKKLLTHLLNHINSLDEMKVSVDGDKKIEIIPKDVFEKMFKKTKKKNKKKVVKDDD